MDSLSICSKHQWLRKKEKPVNNGVKYAKEVRNDLGIIMERVRYESSFKHLIGLFEHLLQASVVKKERKSSK